MKPNKLVKEIESLSGKDADRFAKKMLEKQCDLKNSKEFEKGRAYERISDDSFFHLFFGWACIIMAIAWFFFSVWSFKQRVWGMFYLLVFGIVSLYIGYSNKRKLEKLK